MGPDLHLIAQTRQDTGREPFTPLAHTRFDLNSQGPRSRSCSKGTRCSGSSIEGGISLGLNLYREATDILLPGCYQSVPHQDDPGRHSTIPDRFGLWGLGLLGYPEYVVRCNS